MANIKTTEGLMKAQTRIAQGAKKVVKKVVKVIDKNFIEPSRRVNKINKQKDAALGARIEADKYGEVYNPNK